MTRLINGESPAPVQFRQDDYWHELAADFNRVRAMIPDQDPATWEAEGDAGDVDRFDDVILRR